MAVKIKLKRVGKIHAPQYRIVVADSRTARNGRAIEEIGIYQPVSNPSIMQVKSDRAQYWLSVGAQPTSAVEAILKVTGDWQKFKGLPGAEGVDVAKHERQFVCPLRLADIARGVVEAGVALHGLGHRLHGRVELLWRTSVTGAVWRAQIADA